MSTSYFPNKSTFGFKNQDNLNAFVERHELIRLNYNNFKFDRWISLYTRIERHFTLVHLETGIILLVKIYEKVTKYDYRYCCTTSEMNRKKGEPWKFNGYSTCRVNSNHPSSTRFLMSEIQSGTYDFTKGNAKEQRICIKKKKLLEAAHVKSFDNAFIWKLSYKNKNDVRLLRKLNNSSSAILKDDDYFGFGEAEAGLGYVAFDLIQILSKLPKKDWPSSDRSLKAMHDYASAIQRRKLRYKQLSESKKLITKTIKRNTVPRKVFLELLQEKYPELTFKPIVTAEEFLNAGDKFNNCVAGYATRNNLLVFDVSGPWIEDTCLGIDSLNLRVYQCYGLSNSISKLDPVITELFKSETFYSIVENKLKEYKEKELNEKVNV